MYGEILRRRGVRAVTWFHADHWEPWAQGVNEISVRRVDNFLRQARTSRFADKMTLFYLSGLEYRLKDSDRRRSGEEILELYPRTEVRNDLVREALGQLRAQTNVEFQVHLHHEHLVGNDGDWGDLHRALKGLTDPAQDARRLHYLLKTELGVLRRDTGLPLDKWAFVHGMWALNGSDRTVCQIDNEIEILMEHGCWGDFSFPAGRYHCDPTILQQPYTCVPVTGAKAYDDPLSEPIAVDVGANAMRDGRFLIWNSKAKHDVCSLDYNGSENRRPIKNADHIVCSWLSACPVIDHTLYIKTHGHSMDVSYFEEGGRIPLAHPDIEAMFELLQRTCDNVKVELKLATVDEVAASLRDLDRRADATPRAPATSAIKASELTGAQFSGGILKGAKSPPSLSLTNLVAVSILRDWLADDPGRERAAGEYYTARLARGRLFLDSDLAIAEYSRKRFGAQTRFVELGFGYGELSILLALCGFGATGFEVDAGRRAGALAVVDGLTRQGVETGNLSLLLDAFPVGLKLDMFARDAETVFVCTNVTSTNVMENIKDIFRALRMFDHLILDLSRFGMARDEQSVRDLIAEFRRMGFVEVAKVYSSNDTPDIRHFERLAVNEQGVATLSIPASVDELRYSDLGNPVPRRLQQAPFHIFEGREIPLAAVLPRLPMSPSAWLPGTPVQVGLFPSAFGKPGGGPPVLRQGADASSSSFVFGQFGGHSVECSYGVFRCLLLDPDAGRDLQALEIFRFAAENIVHTCVDKAIVLPWASRTRYVRPDLLLGKLFLSDQPLAIHCDHAAQVTAYLLHLSGYKVREVPLVDPAVNSGHVVMEVFLPELAKWVMLDPDFGVVVANRAGVLLGTAEIIANRNREQELEIRRVVDKRWTRERFDVCEAYGGQLTWTAQDSMGPPTVQGDSYFKVMDRCFIQRLEVAYRFEDGFEDSRVDVVSGGDSNEAPSSGAAVAAASTDQSRVPA